MKKISVLSLCVLLFSANAGEKVQKKFSFYMPLPDGTKIEKSYSIDSNGYFSGKFFEIYDGPRKDMFHLAGMIRILNSYSHDTEPEEKLIKEIYSRIPVEKIPLVFRKGEELKYFLSGTF